MDRLHLLEGQETADFSPSALKIGYSYRNLNNLFRQMSNLFWVYVWPFRFHLAGCGLVILWLWGMGFLVPHEVHVLCSCFSVLCSNAMSFVCQVAAGFTGWDLQVV